MQIFILQLKQNQPHSVDRANRWTVSIVRGIVQSDNSQGRKGFCEDCTINSNPRTWREIIRDRCWISPRQRVLSIYRLSLRLVSVSEQTPTLRQFVFFVPFFRVYVFGSAISSNLCDECSLLEWHTSDRKRWQTTSRWFYVSLRQRQCESSISNRALYKRKAHANYESKFLKTDCHMCS